MKSIRKMDESEYRIYLKTKFHFSDSMLDGKMECITLCDLMRLLEINSELLDLVKQNDKFRSDHLAACSD